MTDLLRRRLANSPAASGRIPTLEPIKVVANDRRKLLRLPITPRQIFQFWQQTPGGSLLDSVAHARVTGAVIYETITARIVSQEAPQLSREATAKFTRQARKPADYSYAQHFSEALNLVASPGQVMHCQVSIITPLIIPWQFVKATGANSGAAHEFAVSD